MAISQRLEIRQGQSLVMTPQLQQAIKLLQLSNLELADYVEQELERNPLLERDDNAPAEPERQAEEAAPANEALDTALTREDFSKAEDMDAGRDDMYPDDKPDRGEGDSSQPLTDWSTVRSSGARLEGDEDGLENILGSGVSLKDHLLDQLAIAAFDAERRLICLSLIDCVDEAGYLRGDLQEIAERLGTSLDQVHDVLNVLQGFDPPGVAARALAETRPRVRLRARAAGRPRRVRAGGAGWRLACRTQR